MTCTPRPLPLRVLAAIYSHPHRRRTQSPDSVPHRHGWRRSPVQAVAVIPHRRLNFPAKSGVVILVVNSEAFLDISTAAVNMEDLDIYMPLLIGIAASDPTESSEADIQIYIHKIKTSTTKNRDRIRNQKGKIKKQTTRLQRFCLVRFVNSLICDFLW